MARVICCIFPTLRMRRRISRVLGTIVAPCYGKRSGALRSSLLEQIAPFTMLLPVRPTRPRSIPP
jgi:hypothetical protein